MDSNKSLEQLISENENIRAVYRGCTYPYCFCTGKCKEVIGFIDLKTGKNINNDKRKLPTNE